MINFILNLLAWILPADLRQISHDDINRETIGNTAYKKTAYYTAVRRVK